MAYGTGISFFIMLRCGCTVQRAHKFDKIVDTRQSVKRLTSHTRVRSVRSAGETADGGMRMAVTSVTVSRETTPSEHTTAAQAQSPIRHNSQVGSSGSYEPSGADSYELSLILKC